MSLTNAPEGPHPDNHYDDPKPYLLSDGQHFFKYRRDKVNNRILRASLFDRTITVVDDIRVTCYEHIIEKSHEEVKQYFENKIKQ